MKPLVIIPTYNEMESLPRIVPDVLAQDESLSILIVDDNSPDGTGDLADRMA
ncbi:MAG TPA: glycosyltransferase, partial [Acidobacteriota bacterium]|nr:glycosyltransferase [Acidobacteriota bacterium]